MKKKIFCKKCGKILNLKQIDGDYLLCSCGSKQKIPSHLIEIEKIPQKAEIGRGIAKEEKTKGFPHICKKCGHDECDIDDVGASYADESDVYLYRCKKCGYVERQADGTGNK